VIDKRANFKFNPAQRAALLKQQLPFKTGFQPLIYGYGFTQKGPRRLRIK
jgi:hypothetical protein